MFKIFNKNRLINFSLCCIVIKAQIFNVRSDNLIAKKFYEKNGMKIVGQTSWTKDGVKNALPGDVYMYDNVQDIL